MKNLLKEFLSPFKRVYKQYTYIFNKGKFGYIGKNVTLRGPISFGYLPLIYLYDNTNLLPDTNFNMTKDGGKFIMKRNSGAASGLTVINHNHSVNPPIGIFHKEYLNAGQGNIGKDIVIDEDVWIAANVTLLVGAYIGRGAIVGAGSVVRNQIPPYSIVIGNPAKVIGFKYTPEEIIEHERILYNEEERIPLNKLIKNYQKYYLNRIKEIHNIVKI